MDTNSSQTARTGFCTCGVPVAEHFDSHNRTLTCNAARARWTRRQQAAASHLATVRGSLAIVVLASRGVHATPDSAFGNLTLDEQSTVALAAEAAITSLDRSRRKVARERGIAAGLKAFIRISGRRRDSIDWKLERDLREIATDVLNANDCALHGFTPITEAEIAAIERRELLPPTSPVRRIVESAAVAEGEVQ